MVLYCVYKRLYIRHDIYFKPYERTSGGEMLVRNRINAITYIVA